jgi:hypothetical protein
MAGLEPAIPTSEWSQIHALDHATASVLFTVLIRQMGYLLKWDQHWR